MGVGIHCTGLKASYDSNECSSMRMHDKETIRMQLKHHSGKLPDDMLTIDEVANFLRVHPVTIRRWEKQNQLKSCRIGPKRSIRFTRKDVSAFIARSIESGTMIAPLLKKTLKTTGEAGGDKSVRQKQRTAER